MPPFRLNVNPIPPLAVAVIDPLDCVVVGSVFVLFTVIVTPAQGLVEPKITVVIPVQPFEFFAVIV